VEVSPTGALGPSLVAHRDGLVLGHVGLASFHRGQRLWVGVAAVPRHDDDALETLARALGAMRGLVDRQPSPGALLAAVRDDLAASGELACEVELLILALADGSGALAYASAGSWSPRSLPITPAPALGADPSPHPDDYPEHTVVLAPGDTLTLAADGRQLSLALTHHAPVAAHEAHTLALELSSELDAIERATRLFDAFAAAHRVPDATRRTLDIALDDLLNNIISYAYDGQPDHVIDVRVELSQGALVASFADDGPAFDPFAMAAPDTELDLDERDIGGLGVHLVKTMMDDARYERRDGRNVVTVTKHFQPLASAQGSTPQG